MIVFKWLYFKGKSKLQSRALLPFFSCIQAGFSVVYKQDCCVMLEGIITLLFTLFRDYLLRRCAWVVGWRQVDLGQEILCVNWTGSWDILIAD
jgi:hypothetical protein